MGPVLIVDDEFIISETLRAYVEELGFEVCGTAARADEALALALQHQPSLILMDVRLNGPCDGIDASRKILDRLRSDIIFVTGSREPETLLRIEAINPAAVLFKPISAGQLASAIRGLQERG